MSYDIPLVTIDSALLATAHAPDHVTCI